MAGARLDSLRKFVSTLINEGADQPQGVCYRPQKGAKNRGATGAKDGTERHIRRNCQSSRAGCSAHLPGLRIYADHRPHLKNLGPEKLNAVRDCVYVCRVVPGPDAPDEVPKVQATSGCVRVPQGISH